MSHMLDEIQQQPDVISGLAEHENEAAETLAAEIERREIDLVVMAARGTSDHAAIYGKYLLEIRNAMPVALADPSVVTLYAAKLKLQRALVIGISQSGEATDVAEFLTLAKECGALTAAITNESGSLLTRIADHTTLCHAGNELGVAATKTYTSTLAAFYLLSCALAHDDTCADKLSSSADAMRKVLSFEPYLRGKAERFRFMESGVVVARGFNYATALETTLKLKETSYIGMLAYSAADFLHGPIATVDQGDPCFLIAPQGKAYQSMFELAERLRDLGAELVITSSEDEILSLATIPIRMPGGLDEKLTPLTYVIPGQLLAYHMALSRGSDPDRPRGLSKVTLTK